MVMSPMVGTRSRLMPAAAPLAERAGAELPPVAVCATRGDAPAGGELVTAASKLLGVANAAKVGAGEVTTYGVKPDADGDAVASAGKTAPVAASTPAATAAVIIVFCLRLVSGCLVVIVILVDV
jgi:hypothetical protein